MNTSLQIAKRFLGSEVDVIIDRSLGSKHPKHGFIYEVNYGFIPGTKAPDGEELDAYVLGVEKPVKEFHGSCVAVVHRLDDDDDKLVIVPEGFEMTDEQIDQDIEFQEKWFKHEIIRR